MFAEEGPLLLNSPSSNSTQDFNHFLQCTERPTGPLFWSLFCSISFLLGFSASLIVLWELLQRCRHGAFNDIFMLNLSFIDLTFTVTLLPSVCNYMLLHIIQVSQTSAFLQGLPLCGRPLFMACICGDCYFAVVHPIVYKTSKNVNMIRKIASVTVWLITTCFGSFLIILNEPFTTPLISAPLILALPVITFCDISVLRALRKPDPSGNSNIHPQKKRALHIIINSFIMTFTVYLPPAIFFSFAEILPMTKTDYFCTLTFYGMCFWIAGCVIMPALYLDTLGKMDLFKAWLRRR
ncbi:lysophosphatidic acid receptor 6-like [Colossoma macropomum]|uniref:lysophosphatidic acid receptor 6-like n=1 Tax=Colossoma macropomum TaxID=42526 RepID=UPI00186458FE|nr:lysophosphatidic acid receptor 6-like [Colossoma macropomum]